MSKMRYEGEEVDATEVEFHTRREDWNEYQLVDGTVIKMKIVVGDIMRIKDRYDNDGNPVYQVKTSNLMFVKTPEELKKKT